MDKLKRLLVAGAAGALLMLLALPTTRWPILNGADILLGRWSSNFFGGYAGIPRPFAPEISEKNLDSPFFGGREKVMNRLLPVAQAEPTNAAVRAHIIRYASLAPPGFQKVTPPTAGSAKKIQEGNQERAANWRKVLEPARQGAALEPKNAYFPMMEAAALVTIGDRSGAVKAWVRASKCTEYDDHAVSEVDENTRLYEAKYGYRGEIIRTVFLMSVILPQYSAYKRVPELLRDSKPDDLEVRAATVLIGRLLIDKASTLISIMVGRNLLVSGISETPEFGKGQWPKSKDLARKLGLDLAVRFRKEGFADAATCLETVLPASSPYQKLEEPDVFLFADGYGGLESPAPFVLAATLGALLLVPCLVFLCVLPRREKVISTHWVWLALPMFTIGTAGLEDFLMASFLPIAFLALEGRSEGWKRLCTWLAWILSVGLILTWGPQSFVGGAYIIAFFLSRSNRDQPARLWVGIAWLLIGSAACAGLYALTASGQVETQSWLGLVGLVLALAWVRPLSGHKVKDVLPLAMPLLVAVLAGSVIWVLRLNEQTRAQNGAWLQEVNVIRAKVGLN